MKTALITGGARGMGLATARTLFRDGCRVAVMDLAPGEEALHNLRAEGIGEEELLYVRGSITDAADRERLIEEVIRRFGRIDILVNNAGVAPAVRQDLLDMTEDSYERVMGVNVKGTLGMSQAVARRMLSQPPVNGRRGVIVNISSLSAYTSSINRGEYCLSKAAIAMMTRLFADRLAGDGIGVFEVRPGIIATDMTAPVKGKYDAMIEGGLLPISRWGMPQDVADAVSLLCSDRLRYSTGEVINVDGGFHIRRL